MAFPSASGHGNLPSGNFSPVIYSKKTQMAFRKSAVCEAITNNDYFGEISNLGDTVNIIKEPEITVQNYERGTQIQAQDLSGYGCESMTAALAAAGCAFGYVQTTQKRALTHIQSLQVERSETFLHVDEATLRNLELLANQQGRKAATLLSVLDDTIPPTTSCTLSVVW